MVDRARAHAWGSSASREAGASTDAYARTAPRSDRTLRNGIDTMFTQPSNVLPEMTGRKSYCLITDDDKLYTFRQQPEVKRPAQVKAQRTIDLASYSFVHRDPDNPKRRVLESLAKEKLAFAVFDFGIKMKIVMVIQMA